jgi:hypothetical protein
MSSPTEPCSGVQAHHPDQLPDALRDLDYGPVPASLFDQVATKPVPAAMVDELDLLRYTVLLERHQRLHIELELERTRVNTLLAQQKDNGDKLGALLDALGTKYNVDFHQHRIQPDGSIIPVK